MTNDKPVVTKDGVIVNKFRGERKAPAPYQPEYERLNLTPIVTEPTAPFVTSRGGRRLVASKRPQQELEGVSGQIPSVKQVPKQTRVSVGTHTDQMWASLDGASDWTADKEDPDVVYEEQADTSQIIDNNDYVDTDGMQQEGEPEVVEQTDRVVKPGEFVLLFRGKTILSGATEEQLCKEMESIIYGDSSFAGEDIKAGDFMAFKRVTLKLGVSIK